MIKFIVVGLILLILIGFVIWNLNKSKKGLIVLGKQLADASEKEKQRIESANLAKSPLPDFNYSKWINEQSLINPTENELDSKILELCREFKSYDIEKRNEVRKSISQDEIYTLLEFSKRAIIFGLRKKEASYINNGFVAVSIIESERCDYRDVIVTLSFLNFGLEKLNINSQAIFDEAMRLSEENTGKLIKEFSALSNKQNNLETMGGYTEIETPYGISFIQTNYENYNPEKNLAKILFDISDYIFNDKYRKGTITIGEEIAPIWLSADNNKKIEKIISNATGCASLSTELKNEFHPKSDAQMLLMYLAEFKDDESLQFLNEHVNTNMPTTFSRLSFVEGNIFCVAVQRAIMADVDDFETNKSLKRFESQIKEIIKKN